MERFRCPGQLSLAAAADAMKSCRLAPSPPAEQIKACLREEPGTAGRCAVVLWKNGGPEEIGNRYRNRREIVPAGGKFPARMEKRAVNRRRDEVEFQPERPPIPVSSKPQIGYCDRLPERKRNLRFLVFDRNCDPLHPGIDTVAGTPIKEFPQ